MAANNDAQQHRSISGWRTSMATSVDIRFAWNCGMPSRRSCRKLDVRSAMRRRGWTARWDFFPGQFLRDFFGRMHPLEFVNFILFWICGFLACLRFGAELLCLWIGGSGIVSLKRIFSALPGVDGELQNVRTSVDAIKGSFLVESRVLTC